MDGERTRRPVLEVGSDRQGAGRDRQRNGHRARPGDTSVGRITKMIAQNNPPEAPGTAIVIPNADMQAKLRQMIEQRVQDDSVRVVDTGDSNLGVFFIHLNPGQTPQEPIQLMSHNDVTEVY